MSWIAAILNNQRWQSLKIENLISKAYLEYFKCLIHCWWGTGLITIEDQSLTAHGYQLLCLATSHWVGNNRELFDVSGIFRSVLLIVYGGELITIEDSSPSAHGYLLLLLARSQLVDSNIEFEVSGICWGVSLIAGRAHFQYIEDPSLVTLLFNIR